MPVVAFRKLTRALRAIGAVHVRTNGSHQRWTLGSCHTTVPAHNTVPAGTVAAIERDLAPCAGSDRWLRDQL